MSAIVTLLDGREESQGILSVATALRDLEGARLHIVSVGESTTTPELFERHGYDADAVAGCVVTHCAAPQNVVRTVLELVAREPSSTVVLPTVGPSDAAHRSLGGYARGIMAEIDRPVVLVRPGGVSAGWKLGEVLLPHDSTPSTTAAIGPAAAMAEKADAKLLALHVATPGSRAGEPGSIPIPRYMDQPQHEWPEWASEFLERLESVSRLDPERVRLFLGRGETGEEVLRVATAEGADLIVLAWHGTLGPDHARVFKTLLRRTPCPLLVLRVPREPR